MQFLTNLFQDLRISKNSVEGSQTSVRAIQNESHIDTLSEKNRPVIHNEFGCSGITNRIRHNTVADYEKNRGNRFT